MHYENKLQSKEFKIYSCAKHQTLHLLKMPINSIKSVPRAITYYTLTLHKRYTSSNNKNTTTHDAEEPIKNVDNW